MEYGYPDLGVVPNGTQHLIKLVPHLKVIDIQGMRSVEDNISYAILLLVDNSLKIAHFPLNWGGLFFRKAVMPSVLSAGVEQKIKVSLQAKPLLQG